MAHHALESATLKLERANLHTKTLERELRGFFKGQPEPAFRGQFEDNLTRCVFYVERGYERPPGDPFSLILGDALHNLRCSLDHIAWQLVRSGGDPNPDRPTDVQFPIYSTEGSFDSNRARRLPGVAGGPVEVIKSRLSEKGWDNPDNPLIMLRDLSNADKHRTLHLIVTGVSVMRVSFRCHDCRASGAFVPQTRPILEPGAEVGGIRVIITGHDPKVNANLGLQPRVTLEDRQHGVVSALEEIGAEVAEILNAEEISSAVG